MRDIKIDRHESPVNEHVGLRIRRRRTLIGVSQEVLAEQIGLSYQQLQKYERSENRVSAGALWDIAQALGVEPAYFFEDYKDKRKPVDVPEPIPEWWLGADRVGLVTECERGGGTAETPGAVSNEELAAEMLETIEAVED